MIDTSNTSTTTDIDFRRLARLRRRERRATHHETFLARATGRLFASTDRDELLRQLVGALVHEFAGCAVAASRTNDTLHVIASAGFDSSETGTAVFTAAGQRAIVAAIQGRRSLLLKRGMQSPFVRSGRPAWMMTPLLIGGCGYGALVFASTVRDYDNKDLEVLEELSRRAALVGDYASFRRDQRLTQRPQRATLPSHLAKVPGAKISALYFPAAQKERVGGDWYDTFSIDEHRVLITVGDVKSHGVEASVILDKLRHALEIVAMYKMDPARGLDVAERMLLRSHPDAVATAFVGIIDNRKHMITYANAGHPCPVVRYRDGSVSHLQAEGLPIGARQMRSPQPRLVQSLRDVELILFYTDGITGAKRDVIEGEERVEKAVSHKAISLVKDSANFITRTCLRSSAPRDDVALLALNFLGVDRWDFDSNDQRAGQAARKNFSDRLLHLGVKPAYCIAAELVFGELTANVTRHAPGPVEVALESREFQLVLHVIDRGSNYNVLQPAPSDLFAESGRGLPLVRRLGCKLDVDFIPGFGTHVSAVLPFPSEQLRFEIERPAVTRSIYA